MTRAAKRTVTSVLTTQKRLFSLVPPLPLLNSEYCAEGAVFPKGIGFKAVLHKYVGGDGRGYFDTSSDYPKNTVTNLFPGDTRF